MTAAGEQELNQKLRGSTASPDAIAETWNLEPYYLHHLQGCEQNCKSHVKVYWRSDVHEQSRCITKCYRLLLKLQLQARDQNGGNPTIKITG